MAPTQLGSPLEVAASPSRQTPKAPAPLSSAPFLNFARSLSKYRLSANSSSCSQSLLMLASLSTFFAPLLFKEGSKLLFLVVYIIIPTPELVASVNR